MTYMIKTFLQKLYLSFAFYYIIISQLSAQIIEEPFNELKQYKFYSANKLQTTPKIDGILDDGCWKTDNIISDFLQDEPSNGDVPSELTEVIISYDNKALYIAAFLYDKNIDKTPKRIIKRDDWDNYAMTDFFSIEIDSYHNHQSGFEFLVNSSGTQFDDFIFNDIDRDADWDGVWESGVSSDDKGWYLEIKIPFSQLRFPKKDEHTWGINLNRYLNEENEFISWVVLPRELNGIVSHFGHINNINGIHNDKNTIITPYFILGSTDYNDYELLDSNKMNFGYARLDSISIINKFGIDIKKHLKSNSILDITINPDFGQIESDPEYINLSYYEMYYDEKRPFFMESSTLFDMPIEIFYSRKIGMNHKYVSGKWNDKKDALIKGAVKISGKTSKGLSYGVISALTTDEENGDWMHKMTKGSNTKFLINRLTKDFFSGNSYIGLMTTHYYGNSNKSNIASIDALSYLFNNKLYLDGQLATSNVNGLSGIGASFDGQYTTDYNMTSSFDVEYFDKNFNISHTGFLKRNNLKKIKLNFKINKNRNSLPRLVRSLAINIYTKYEQNLDNILLDKYIGVSVLSNFVNNYYINSSYIHQFERFNDRMLFDYKDQILQSKSPLSVEPEQFGLIFEMGTDPNKFLSANSNLAYVKNTFGDNTLVSGIKLNYYTDNSSLSINWNRTTADQSYYWLDIFDEISYYDMAPNDTVSHYIFSNVNSIENRINVRYSLNITQNASIEFYSEYYMNNHSYSNYSELTLDSQYPLATTDFIEVLIDEIYFTEQELQDGFVPGEENLIDPNDYIYFYPKNNRLNINLVFNWQYRSGSNIYFVLTRSRETIGKEFNSIGNFINYFPESNELMELFRDYSVFVRMDYRFNI